MDYRRVLEDSKLKDLVERTRCSHGEKCLGPSYCESPFLYDCEVKKFLRKM